MDRLQITTLTEQLETIQVSFGQIKAIAKDKRRAINDERRIDFLGKMMEILNAEYTEDEVSRLVALAEAKASTNQ